MGHSTDAHCFGCGYDTRLAVGSGMNFLGPSFAPVSCPNCRTVTVADVTKAPLACACCASTDVIDMEDLRFPPRGPDCGSSRRAPTADEVLETIKGIIEGEEATSVHSNARLLYRCPQCGRLELEFGTNVGKYPHVMWD